MGNPAILDLLDTARRLADDWNMPSVSMLDAYVSVEHELALHFPDLTDEYREYVADSMVRRIKRDA